VSGPQKVCSQVETSWSDASMMRPHWCASAQSCSTRWVSPAGGAGAARRSAAAAWCRAQFEQPACFAAFVGGRSRSGQEITLRPPVTQEWDLAFTAFAWVPLHARRVVQGEGFTAFADRPRRLRLFLDTYAWDGPLAEFVSTVQARVTASAEGIQRTAATGDPAYQRMLDTGVDESLRTAVRELEDFRSEVET
jgi:hypothetical protein